MVPPPQAETSVAVQAFELGQETTHSANPNPTYNPADQVNGLFSGSRALAPANETSTPTEILSSSVQPRKSGGGTTDEKPTSSSSTSAAVSAATIAASPHSAALHGGGHTGNASHAAPSQTTNYTTENLVTTLKASQPPPAGGTLSYTAGPNGSDLTLTLDAHIRSQLDLVSNRTGKVVASAPLGQVERVVVTGANYANDTLTVNMSKPFWLSGGITFSGGAGPYDTLAVIAPKGGSVAYTAIGKGSGIANVLLNGHDTAIAFTGLEPVDIQATNYTFTPSSAMGAGGTSPSANATVNVAIGTTTGPTGKPINVITGTIGGTAFEKVNLVDVTNLDINLAGTSTPYTGNQTVTVGAGGFVTPTLANVMIETGSGTNTVAIDGANPALPVSGGAVTIDGGAGTTSIVAAGAYASVELAAAGPTSGSLILDGSTLGFSHVATLELPASASSISYLDGAGSDTVAISDTSGAALPSGGTAVLTISDSNGPTAEFAAMPAGLAIVGGGGTDTLAGPVTNTTWTISGANSGSLDGITFSGFVNLQGAANNNDTFVFTPSGSESGLVAGGAGGYDTVVLSGGNFGSVSYNPTGPSSGTIVRDGSVITYTGMEPITNSGGSAKAVFFLPNTGYSATLSANSRGELVLSSSTGSFETTTFTAPTASLTINLGRGGGSLTINLGTITLAASLTVEGPATTGATRAGRDSVTVGQNLSTPGQSVDLHAATVTVATGVTIDTRQRSGVGPTSVTSGNSGDITVEGKSITVASGASLRADVTAGSGYTAGNITLTAEDTRPRLLNLLYNLSLLSIKKRTATVKVAGATIEGGNVTISAKAEDIAVADSQPPYVKGLIKDFFNMLNQLPGIALSSITGVSGQIDWRNSSANVTLTGATITSSGDVSVSSTSDANASFSTVALSGKLNPYFTLSIGFGRAESTAKTTLNSTSIDAAGNVSVTSDATSEAEITSRVAANTGISGTGVSAKNVSLSVGIGDTSETAHTTVSSGSTITTTGGRVEITSDGHVGDSVVSAPTVYQDGLAGIGVSLNFDNANVKTRVDGTVNQLGGAPAQSFDSASAVDTANGTIAIPNQPFAEGQPVVYSDGGGTPIGGLSNGSTYYVIVVDGNTIQLANGPTITLNNSQVNPLSTQTLSQLSTVGFGPSDVNTSNNTISISNIATSGLTDGQTVTYIGSSSGAVGGLVQNQHYTVQVEKNSNKIQLLDPSSGAVVDLTSTGPSGSTNLLEYLTATQSFNPTTAVNSANGTIALSQNPFTTGEPVVYQTDPTLSTSEPVYGYSLNAMGKLVKVRLGSPRIPDRAIGGLTNGQVYWVVRVDAHHIRLASSRQAALAAAPIVLTSTGSGTQSLAGADAGAGLDIKASLDAENMVTAGAHLTGEKLLWPGVAQEGVTSTDVLLSGLAQLGNAMGLAERGSKVLAKLFDEVPKLEGSNAKFMGAGSVAINYVNHTVQATIGPKANVKADSLELSSEISQKVKVASTAGAAKPEEGTVQKAVAVGVAFGLYSNTSKAVIEGGASVNASGVVEVTSRIDYPFRIEDPFATVNPLAYLKDLGPEGWAHFMDGTLGFASGLFNVWVTSAAKATSAGVGGSLAVTVYNNDSEAIIGSGATINQDVAPRFRTGAQTVDVHAATEMHLVEVAGAGSLGLNIEGGAKAVEHFKESGFSGAITALANPFGAGGGRSGIGGSALVNLIFNRTVAKIESGATIFTSVPSGSSSDPSGLTVAAENDVFDLAIAQAGAKSSNFTFTGSVSVGVIQATTLAEIATGVTVTGGPIAVNADGTIDRISVAGGVAVGQNTGLGFSIGLNIVSRDTEAFIGARRGSTPPKNAPPPTDITITGPISVTATSHGKLWTFALAGSGTMKSASKGQTTDELKNNPASEQSTIQDVKTVVAKDVEKAVQQEEAKTGTAGAGDLGLNLVLGEKTLAYINDTTTYTQSAKNNTTSTASNMSITANSDTSSMGTVTVSAADTTAIWAFAGSVAVSTTGKEGSKGLAGSFAINVVSLDTEAFIDVATMTAINVNSGSTSSNSSTNSSSSTTDALSVTAKNEVLVRAFSAGGSGATKESGVAIAGSVSVNVLVATTDAYLVGGVATVSGWDNALVQATDESQIWSVAGAASYGGKTGVGVAIALNFIGYSNQPNIAPNSPSGTIAYVSGSTIYLSGGLLKVAATSKSAAKRARIVAVSGSVGVNSSSAGGAGAGMISVNWIRENTEAYLAGLQQGKTTVPTTVDQTGSTAASLEVRAEDTSSIFALGGAVGIGNKAGVGAAIGFNGIHDSVFTYLDNTNVTLAGSVTLTADSTARIVAASVGLGAGASGFGGAGSISVNSISDTIAAYIDYESTINVGSDVTVGATDNSALISIGGGVAGATGTASVGAAVSYNLIANTIRAYIHYSTVDSSGGGVALNASSSPLLVAVAVGGGGAKTFGGGASITVNSIANTVVADIEDSTIVAPSALAGNVYVTAGESAKMYVVAGAGALATSGVAVGASFAYNYIGGTFDGSHPAAVLLSGGDTNPIVNNGTSGAPDEVDAYIVGSAVTAGGSVDVTAGLGGPTKLPAMSSITFVPSTAVDTTTGIITLSSLHGLTTGDAVIYHAAGGTPIGGLQDGSLYYVIVVSPTQIELAQSYQKAELGNALALSTATSTQKQSFDYSQVDLSVASPILPIPISTQMTTVTFGGAGARTVAVGAAVSLDFVRASAAAYISDTPVSTTPNGTTVPLAVSGLTGVNVTASDGTKMTNIAVGFAGSTGVSVGASVALTSVKNDISADVSNALVEAGGSGLSVNASDSSTLRSVAVGAALSGSDAAAISVGAAVAVNRVDNNITASISGGSTVTAAATAVTAEDDSVSTLWAVGASLAVTIAEEPSAAVAAGISFAENVDSNTVSASIDTSGGTVTSTTGGVAVTATSTATLASHSYAASAAVLAGGSGGAAVSGAGAQAANVILTSVKAFISDSSVRSAGTVAIDATDTSTITARVLSASVAAGISGATSVGVAIGGSLAENLIGWHHLVNSTKDPATVEAYLLDSSVSAIGSLTLSATADETIDARVRSGSVGVGGGGGVGVGAAGAGSSAKNLISTTVKAYIDGDAPPGISAANLSLSAGDTSSVTAKTGAASIAVSFSGGTSVAAAVTGSHATNTIENDVEAYIENISLIKTKNNVPPPTTTLQTATGGISLSAEEKATITSLAVAASVSASISETGVSFSAAGLMSKNTISNTVSAYISKSTAAIDSAKGVTITASDTPTISATAVVISGTGSVVGFAAGGIIADNSINDTVSSYLTASTLTAQSGDISITSTSTPTVNASATTVSVSISIGGSIAGEISKTTINRVTSAYLGAGTYTAQTGGILVKASSTATASPSLTNGSLGGVSVAGIISKAEIGGSTEAYAAGGTYKARAGGITVEATSTSTLKPKLVGGSVGAVSGNGMISHASLGGTTEAYTAGGTYTASDGIAVRATSTAVLDPKLLGGTVGALGVNGMLSEAASTATTNAYAAGGTYKARAGGITVVATSSMTLDPTLTGGSVAGSAVNGILSRAMSCAMTAAYAAGGTYTANGGGITIDATSTSTLDPTLTGGSVGAVSGNGMLSMAELGGTTESYAAGGTFRTSTGTIIVEAASTSTLDPTLTGGSVGSEGVNGMLSDALLTATTDAYTAGGTYRAGDGIAVQANSGSTLDPTLTGGSVGAVGINGMLSEAASTATTDAQTAGGTYRARTGGIAVEAGSTSTLDPTLTGGSVGVVSGSGMLSGATLGGTTEAYAAGGTYTAAGDIIVRATSTARLDPNLLSVSAGAVTGTGLLSEAKSSGMTEAFLDGGSYTAPGAGVNVRANSSAALDPNVTGASGGSASIAAMLSDAEVHGATDAYVAGSTTVSGSGLSVEALDASAATPTTTVAGIGGITGSGASETTIIDRAVSAYVAKGATLTLGNGALAIKSASTDSAFGQLYGGSGGAIDVTALTVDMELSGTTSAWIGDGATVTAGRLDLAASASDSVTSETSAGSIGLASGALLSIAASDTSSVDAYVGPKMGSVSAGNPTSVTIGGNATIAANMTSNVVTDANAGALSLSGGGVGSTTSLTDAPQVQAYLGDGAQLTAGGSISVESTAVVNGTASAVGLSASGGYSVTGVTIGVSVAPNVGAFSAGGGSVSGAKVTFESLVNEDGTGKSIEPSVKGSTVGPAYATITLGSAGLIGGAAGATLNVSDSPSVATYVGEGTTISSTGAVTVESGAFQLAQIDGLSGSGGLGAGIGVVNPTATAGGTVSSRFDGTLARAASLTVLDNATARTSVESRAGGASGTVALTSTTVTATTDPTVSASVGSHAQVAALGSIEIEALAYTGAKAEAAAMTYAVGATIGKVTVSATDAPTVSAAVGSGALVTSAAGDVTVLAGNEYDPGTPPTNGSFTGGIPALAVMGSRAPSGTVSVGATTISAVDRAIVSANLDAGAAVHATKGTVWVVAEGNNQSTASARSSSGAAIDVAGTNVAAKAAGTTSASLLGVVTMPGGSAGANDVQVIANAVDEANANAESGGQTLTLGSAGSSSLSATSSPTVSAEAGGTIIASGSVTISSAATTGAHAVTSNSSKGIVEGGTVSTNATIAPAVKTVIDPGAVIDAGGELTISSTQGKAPANYASGNFNAATDVNTTTNTINLGAPTGLQTGDTVVYKAGSGNTIIGGLVDGRTYGVIVPVDSSGKPVPNNLELGVTFNAGSSSPQVNLTTDTITFSTPDHLATGDRVVYEPGSGNTSIGGLTSGDVYVVRVMKPTTIKLMPVTSFTSGDVNASDNTITIPANGFLNGEAVTYDAPAPTIFQNSQIDHSTYSIDLGPSNPFHTGDAVVYNSLSGQNVNGLQAQTVYYVIADPKNPNIIELTTQQSPTSAQWDSKSVVPLSAPAGSSGSNLQSLLKTSDQAIGGLTDTGTYYIMNANSPTGTFQLAGSPNGTAITLTPTGQNGEPLTGTSTLEPNLFTFTGSNIANNTITLNKAAFADGQAVTYNAPTGASFTGSDVNTANAPGKNYISLGQGNPLTISGEAVTYEGSGIGGLTKGTEYWVIYDSHNPQYVQLASSYANATAKSPTPITLTKPSSGSQGPSIDSLTPVAVGGLTDGVTYYVVNANAAAGNFQLAKSAGGTPIALNPTDPGGSEALVGENTIGTEGIDFTGLPNAAPATVTQALVVDLTSPGHGTQTLQGVGEAASAASSPSGSDSVTANESASGGGAVLLAKASVSASSTPTAETSIGANARLSAVNLAITSSSETDLVASSADAGAGGLAVSEASASVSTVNGSTVLIGDGASIAAENDATVTSNAVENTTVLSSTRGKSGLSVTTADSSASIGYASEVMISPKARVSAGSELTVKAMSDVNGALSATSDATGFGATAKANPDGSEGLFVGHTPSQSATTETSVAPGALLTAPVVNLEATVTGMDLAATTSATSTALGADTTSIAKVVANDLADVVVGGTVEGSTVSIQARHEDVSLASVAYARSDSIAADTNATADTSETGTSKVYLQKGSNVVVGAIPGGTPALTINASQDIVQYSHTTVWKGARHTYTPPPIKIYRPAFSLHHKPHFYFVLVATFQLPPVTVNTDSGSAQAGGTFQPERTVILDGTITLLPTATPVLVIEPNSTGNGAVITQDNGFTVNNGLGQGSVITGAGTSLSVHQVAATSSPGQVFVETPLQGNFGGSADATVTGTGTVRETYPTITITNYSNLPLIVNELTAAATASPTSVDVVPSGSTHSLDLHYGINFGPTAITVDNAGNGTLTVAGLIDNPLGSTAMTSGAAIVEANGGVIRADAVRLAASGDIGQASDPIVVQLTGSPDRPASLGAVAGGSVYMDLVGKELVSTAAGTPADPTFDLKTISASGNIDLVVRPSLDGTLAEGSLPSATLTGTQIASRYAVGAVKAGGTVNIGTLSVGSAPTPISFSLLGGSGGGPIVAAGGALDLVASGSIVNLNVTGQPDISAPQIGLSAGYGADSGSIGSATAPLTIEAASASPTVDAQAAGGIWITVVGGGGVNVANLLSASGNIVLAVPDLPSPGQDIMLGSGSIISAANGSVALLAGDNVTMAPGSSIAARGSVTISGDVGNADPGIGAMILLEGQITASSALITGGPDGDVIAIRRVTPGTPTTIDSGGGGDTIFVGSKATLAGDNGGILSTIAAPLTVNGGDGKAILVLDDSGSAQNESAWLGPGTVTGLGMTSGVSYSRLEKVVLYGGSADNTYHFVDNWGVITVIDQAGSGYNTLDFSAVTTPLTFHIQYRRGSAVSGANEVTFSNIERVVGGRGGSTVYGPNAATLWRLTGYHAFDAEGMSFSAITALVGGSGNDRFVFGRNVDFGGSIDGGGGNNTLDYSAYTLPVVADLATGAATGTTGIRNIQNLYGGSANDALVGNNENNIIIGNAGSDTITAGNGNDILIGDSGEVVYANGQVVLVESTHPTVGGNDVITAGSGNDVIIGGAGSDTITAAAGALSHDIVIGDNGYATFGGTAPFANGQSSSTVGFNFAGYGFGGSTVTGTAGASGAAAGNWNNLEGGSGSYGGSASQKVLFGTGAQAGGVSIAWGTMVNGSLSGEAVVSQESYGWWQEHQSGADSQNAQLLDSYLTAPAGQSVGAEVSGLSYYYASYDVYVYLGGTSGAAGPGGHEGWGGAGQASQITTVGDGSTSYYLTTSSGQTVEGTLVQVTSTNPNAPGMGDYVVFSGLTANSFTVTAVSSVVGGRDAWRRAAPVGIAGVAIVGRKLPIDRIATTSPAVGGNNTISLAGGSNIVFGGAGADVITVGGTGNNIVVGDNGEATLVDGVVRSLTSTNPTVGGNDTITTGSGNDVLVGGAGGDTLDGGAGNNVVFGDNAAVTFFAGGQLGVTLLAPAVGGNDTLIAGPGTNLLYGQAGNDTYVFPAGAYGNDTIVEAGNNNPYGLPNDPNDTLDFSSFGASVRIDLGTTRTQLVSGSYCGSGPKLFITLSSSTGVEDVIGSAGGDLIIGNSRNNTLVGGPGNDRIYGEGGNDLLAGGGGQDFLDGGSGVNLVYFPGAKTGVYVKLVNCGAGYATDGLGGTDILVNISGAIGTPYADTLIGNDRANFFAGMGGADTIITGAGNDTVVWSEGDGNATIDMGSGHNTLIVNTGASDGTISVARSGSERQSGHDGSSGREGRFGYDARRSGDGLTISGGSGTSAWTLTVRGVGVLVINAADANAVVTRSGLGGGQEGCGGADGERPAVIVHLGAAPFTAADYLALSPDHGLGGEQGGPGEHAAEAHDDDEDTPQLATYTVTGFGTSGMRILGMGGRAGDHSDGRLFTHRGGDSWMPSEVTVPERVNHGGSHLGSVAQGGDSPS